jgi:hypothetical protein
MHLPKLELDQAYDELKIVLRPVIDFFEQFLFAQAEGFSDGATVSTPTAPLPGLPMSLALTAAVR